jgi:hypothetical protein
MIVIKLIYTGKIVLLYTQAEAVDAYAHRNQTNMNIPKVPLSLSPTVLHLKHIINEIPMRSTEGSFFCMPKAVRLCNRGAVTDSHGKLASEWQWQEAARRPQACWLC